MKRLVIIFILLFGISFISATINIGNISNNLEKSYAPGEDIRGWINISIDEEPSNLMITDTFNNSVELKELLDSDSDFLYSCNYKRLFK